MMILTITHQQKYNLHSIKKLEITILINAAENI